MTDAEFTYNNEDESDMGQLHAIHLGFNAIAAARRTMPQGPGSDWCSDCGDDIPEARRAAMPGVFRCIHCQTVFEAQR